MKSLSKWIYSRKNVAGCCAATACIGLYVGGIIDVYWWAIVAGCYVSGYILTPEEKTTVFIHFANETMSDYKGFLDKLYKNSVAYLPDEAAKKLDSIRLTGHELVDFLEKSPEKRIAFDENLVLIKKIFDQYLPNLINTYIKLPKRFAENAELQNKKTSKTQLLEQLEILDTQARKIAYAIYEGDAVALQVSGKILEQKFENNKYFQLAK